MSARALRSTIAVALCALASSGLCAAKEARADVFGAISMLSASPFGQVEWARDPALSEDGRYVVFDGAIGGVAGVWRRETRPGATFEQVAGGDATDPSISADGRFVSFTTNEGASLPAITNGQPGEGEPVQEAPGVYVRDMEKQAGEPGAFTLVSAKDHSTESLTYEFPGEEEEEEGQTSLGAVAAGRSAITADGRTVVFVTTAQSDLDGPGTPALQVAVRHLETDETELVSVRYDPATGRPAVNPETGGPEPVPEEKREYGAVATDGAETQFTQTGGGPVTRAYLPAELPGASISADGSTVAWYGGQISEQARALSSERLDEKYAEPLWRRIAGGASEPTRRVTGGSDPESPGCLEHPEAALPDTPQPGDPCQGPFATQRTGLGTWNGGFESSSDFIPRLSANGDEVAFIAAAPLVSEGAAFAIGGENFNSDVYVRNMTVADEASGLRRITEYASGEPNRISTNGEIADLAISPDGQQVAFATRRTVFPLSSPAYISTPAPVPGLVELYDADLGDETLTRVTRSFEGGTPEHPELENGQEDRYDRPDDGALSPSFDASGTLLAFSSTASNLVFGDGNSPPNGVVGANTQRDGADVFLAPREVFSPEPTPQTISPAPANPSLEPPWRIQVSASALANGTVRLKVRVPGAGLLGAAATSLLAVKSSHSHGRKATRTVARGSSTVHSAGSTVTLELTLSRSYRALAARKGGLLTTLTVTFTAKGHATLRKKITIRFARRATHHKRKGGL